MFSSTLARSSRWLNLGSGLSQTVAAGRRVLDLLDESPAVGRGNKRRYPFAFSGASVRDVSFAYGKEAVLRSVSAEIPAGEIIGINRPRSGSGKSSMLRLLMRFFDPQTGKIALSRHPASAGHHELPARRRELLCAGG